MIPSSPTVSVIMAVKNGGEIMRQAIDSILSQTFTDFEFIIINDGSTDNTLDILSEYKDARLKIFSQENQGLARSLNRAVCLARGKYLARQDHDDISLPRRLELQVRFLDLNINCGLLGTAAEIWEGLNGKSGREHNHPTNSAILKFELIFNNPFVHTSWMFRSEIVKQVGYYTIDPLREPPEDYEYVSRICYQFDVANLPDHLVIYREFSGSLSSEIRPNSDIKKKLFISKLALISSENIAFWNNLSFDNRHARNFGAVLHGCPMSYLGGSSFSDMKKMIILASKSISLNDNTVLDQVIVKKKVNLFIHRFMYSDFIKLRDKLVFLTTTVDGFVTFIFIFKEKLLKRLWQRLTGPGPRREKFMKFFNKRR